MHQFVCTFHVVITIHDGMLPSRSSFINAINFSDKKKSGTRQAKSTDASTDGALKRAAASANMFTYR